MCGIAGFLEAQAGRRRETAQDALRAMSDAIEYRGPDSSGLWYDADHGIGFAHRRLAIVDLTVEGAQPMRSRTGRYVLCFNGEIYNHSKLRERLAGPWRGTSDTETLLAGFEAWGIDATIEASIGMFAMAIWDNQARALTLLRDRFGEKPLYYGWQSRGSAGAVLLFGSELGALRAHPAFDTEISRGALREFMRHGNVGGDRSIYRGIHKLPAGCGLTITAAAPDSAPRPYWSTLAVARASRDRPFGGDAAEARDALEAKLGDSIAQQMIADVPVGAFLSGGVDSSLIVALMCKLAPRAVRTFTIGFHEGQHDEAPHARAVAEHLGTAHTEMYVTARDALELIPRLPSIYTEPFADSSQVPTHLLARLTRAHVTVALSGDCGDELFGGYNRYVSAQKIWRRISGAPRAARAAVAGLLRAVPSSMWDRVASLLASGNSAATRWSRLGEKVQKLANMLEAKDADDLYLSLTSQWLDPGEIVIGEPEAARLRASQVAELAGLDVVEQMMILDALGYMNDDILTKVDRAAMACSLETRVPMLDHRVAEFAWSLPLDFKLRDGQTKWLMREVLYRHVPRELIERPKSGFAMPVDAWLRGPLRDWAEALLSEEALARSGCLVAAPIRARWKEHIEGRRNWYAQLWNVLMFQAWMEHTHVR
jgi:asparagine synthase (glutamine-hydrolysing)